MDFKNLFNLSDKTYDILKFVAIYVIPGVATLIAGLSHIWGIPYSDQIVETLVHTDTFLAGILGISAVKYSKTHPK